MIVTQTPLRISFFGGGSDLPSYFMTSEEPGAVLNMAIDKFVYLSVSDKFEGTVRASYSRTENVEEASQIEHPLIRECLHMAGRHRGVEVVSVSDIPGTGTGLGSSSSFTVGLLRALFPQAAAPDLAESACCIEINRCGAPIGYQDQTVAAYGGICQINFTKANSIDVKQLAIPDSLQEHILLFYTGRTRKADTILKEQSKRSENDSKVREMLTAMARQVKPGAAALMNADYECLGSLLDNAWHMKKQLACGVSDGEIDTLYHRAIEAGAYGGKLCGAGGGGFLFFLADPEKHQDIENALGLRRVRVSPWGHGSRVVFSQP